MSTVASATVIATTLGGTELVPPLLDDAVPPLEEPVAPLLAPPVLLPVDPPDEPLLEAPDEPALPELDPVSPLEPLPLEEVALPEPPPPVDADPPRGCQEPVGRPS